MDLISLDRAKEQIPNVTCDDSVIASMISAASGVIENFCRRKFAQQNYEELHTITGRTPYLFVNNPPISDVQDVRSGQLPALYVNCADPLSQTQKATVEVNDTAVVLERIYNNVTTTNTFTFADYPTFADLAPAINALGSPWTATLPPQFALWQTSDMIREGTWSARNVSLPLLVYWGRPNFRINEEIGELFCPSFWTVGYQSVYVAYTGGYDVIPDEIQYACSALVAQMFANRNLNPALGSVTLDKATWTKAASQALDSLPVAVKLTLNAYKLLTVSRYK